MRPRSPECPSCAPSSRMARAGAGWASAAGSRSADCEGARARRAARLRELFLTVWDIVRFARSRGILCQGRGSAANSAVCYCSASPPSTRRGRAALRALPLGRARASRPTSTSTSSTSGARRSSSTSTAVRPRPRRDGVGDHLLPRRERAPRSRQGVRALARAGRPPREALGAYEDLAEVAPEAHRRGRPRRRRIARAAPDVALCPRAPGVPAPPLDPRRRLRPLAPSRSDEVAPIEPRAMAGPHGDPVGQGRHRRRSGFFKVDVLGARHAHRACRKCLALLDARTDRRRRARHFDPHRRARRDPRRGSRGVRRSICRADTIGVFQIESRAQMSMLPRLQPRKVLRPRHRGGDRPARAHPGRHGAPVPAAARRRGAGDAIPTRCLRRSSSGRSASRSSRSR